MPKQRRRRPLFPPDCFSPTTTLMALPGLLENNGPVVLPVAQANLAPVQANSVCHPVYQFLTKTVLDRNRQDH